MRSQGYSDTIICNMALAEVPDKQIQSLTEQSLQARECRRWYSQCVGELLEDYPWTFALGRLSLAQLVNDRPEVWGYQYAIPDNCAYIGKIFPTAIMAADALSPIPGARLVVPQLPGQINNIYDRNPGVRFEIGEDGASIYCDLANATMEFTKNAISEAVMRPMFVRALTTLLASRLVSALTKDVGRRQQLAQMAMYDANEAKASDKNRQDETWGDWIPDWIAIR